MKQYTVDFVRCGRRREEFVERIEFSRPGLTSRDWKMIIRHLFDIACLGICNEYIVAYVMCDGKKILTIPCDTTEDGSTIRANVRVARPREKFRRYRVMTIAE